MSGKLSRKNRKKGLKTMEFTEVNPEPRNENQHQSQKQNPENQNAETSSTGFSSDHFSGNIPTVEAEIVSGPSKFLNKDEFFGTFELSFAVAGGITALQSLLISQDEQERMQARAASDAIYDICERHPQLHFMIDRNSVYLKAAAAVGPFALVKYQGARAELVARRSAMAKEGAAGE